jgi:hypothetical protein
LPCRFFLCLFILLFISTQIFQGAERNKSDYWGKEEKQKIDLVEEVPDYNSMIDWTTGKVRTEVSITINEENPNIGKIVNNYESLIKDELRQNLIKAMGYVRISDLYLLKDYYSIKSDVRYEIISYADRAVYYPMIQKGKTVLGMVELNLFGKNGIANIFFRDFEKKQLTNYVQSETKEVEYFDGLIIDTLSYKDFNPSIQMRIFDEDGILLYGPETVDKIYLEKYGVCEYTISLNYAFQSHRCGERIFYTIPYDITGKMKTSFILNNKDAARLFASPKTIKNINQSQVIVVKSP